MDENIDLLKKVATKNNVSLQEEFITDDKTVKDVAIAYGGREIHVLFLAEEGKFYAYDITSDYLPGELYMDSLKNGFTIEQRNDEIIASIAAILQAEFKFKSAPSLLNSKRGYFTMPVDGRLVKVFQKRNFFNLPA